MVEKARGAIQAPHTCDSISVAMPRLKALAYLASLAFGFCGLRTSYSVVYS